MDEIEYPCAFQIWGVKDKHGHVVSHLLTAARDEEFWKAWLQKDCDEDDTSYYKEIEFIADSWEDAKRKRDNYLGF